MSLSAKEERELVAKLEDTFQSALEHPSWQEWRSKIAPTCFRYREGDQWTAAERATLKKSVTSRKSPTTRSPVTINRLVGQFVKQKVRVRFPGRNAKTTSSARRRSPDIFLFIRKYR